MALEKYKICPVCGEHNLPNLLECHKCETDLTGIKVIDHQMEQKKPEVSSGTPLLIRVCEGCGTHNLPQVRKCKKCGEDISDIIPTIEKEEQNFSYKLKAVGDDFSVVLDKPVIIIGREAELKEYLGCKMYVSRQHAKFTIVAEKVMIENLSSTNRTFINNQLLAGTEPVALADGDEIGLGGMKINGECQKNAAYFIFQINS